jgi:hypothetical protein
MHVFADADEARQMPRRMGRDYFAFYIRRSVGGGADRGFRAFRANR